MDLMQRLWALRIVEGDDMAEHLNKFGKLANQVEGLSGTGKGIENNELVTLLSLSDPDSYEPIIMARQSRADEVTFDIFASRLLQESARRLVPHTTSLGTSQTSSTTVTAFAARPYGRRRGGFRPGSARGGMRIQNSLRAGRLEGAASSGRSVRTSKPRGKCFYCQREGHWQRDCYKRKAEEAKEGNHKSLGDQTGLAFTVHDLSGTVSNKGTWIIDSGASQHLSSQGEYFANGTYKEMSGKVIEIADVSQIEAVGMGNVSIGNLQLSGVLHVLRAGGNLVSVAQLIDSGYQVSFGTKISTITQDDLRVEGERD